MNTALAVVNALISLMAIADRLGVNLDGVKAKFEEAKSEGRDVTPEEVQAMADAAGAAGAKLDEAINDLPIG